jgi:hypothetical protein
MTLNGVSDWILDLLINQMLTTCDYTLQITVTHAKSFPARSVFASSCLCFRAQVLAEW